MTVHCWYQTQRNQQAAGIIDLESADQQLDFLGNRQFLRHNIFCQTHKRLMRLADFFSFHEAVASVILVFLPTHKK